MEPAFEKPEAALSNRVTANYRRSYSYNSDNYIHKYYLVPEDKAKLWPTDISALDYLARQYSKSCENIADVVFPADPPCATIYYKDLKLEKQVDWHLVQRVMLASELYEQDRRAELTSEEIRAALNLNDWLRSYEKTLLAKKLSIERQLKKELRDEAPFFLDYGVELKLDFYLREDDPFLENNESNRNDWDLTTALMCYMSCSGRTYYPEDETIPPDYWGLGDDQDHNDIRSDDNFYEPVCQANQCMLFHELISHCGVPIKHLIRIGTIWADFEVLQQNAVDVDLSGEQIKVFQLTTQV